MFHAKTPALLAPLMFASLLACDSGADADEDTAPADPYEGAFDDCSPGAIEADLVVFDAMGQPGPPRWSGPGADPETGALIDDGETTYYVATTYLALRPEAIEQFLTLVGPLNEALFSNPGLVAVQLGDSQACAVARTFTVWTDEDAMYDFVGSDAHIEAMTAFPELSRGSSTLISWGDMRAEDISWELAEAKLRNAASYD